MGKLSSSARKKLPKSEFAVPGRKYPIDTANRGRNALSRVAQNGTPKEKAEVRAKVHAKFPGIDADKKGKPMKKKTAERHEAKGEKKHDAHVMRVRGRESRGMKKVMGDVGGHKGVGEHEGYHVGMKKKKG